VAARLLVADSIPKRADFWHVSWFKAAGEGVTNRDFELEKTMKTEIKEIDYLKTWGLFAICATVGGFIVGAVIGGVCGGVLGGFGASMRTIKIVCAGLGFIAGLPVSYFFFRLFVSRLIVQKLTGPTSGNVTPMPAAPGSDQAKAA